MITVSPTKQGRHDKFQGPSMQLDAAGPVMAAHHIREIKDLRKKMLMYRDKMDKLEAENRLLERKLKKVDRAADDYEQVSLCQYITCGLQWFVVVCRGLVFAFVFF